MHKLILILRWISGICFALAALGSLSHPLVAIICLLLAILLIPPALNLVQDLVGKIFPRKYKIGAFIILLILLVVAMPPASPAQINSEQQKTDQNPVSPAPSPNTGQEQLLDQRPPVNPSDNSTDLVSPLTTPSPAPTPSPTPAPSPTPPPKTSTSASPSCDPNYSGGCVPIASDVDCAGGSGDGPAYVKGPVYVVGTDKYRLDGNHDGVACE
jgi:hypothetical protein